MKMPQLLRRKKLRAATARRSVGASAEMDYEEISEPNMKLSRALLIVLLLHVVAVSGIIAFNVIKTRQSSFVPVAAVNPENNPIASIAPTTKSDASNRRSAFEQKEDEPREEAKVSHSPSKSVTKDDHKAGKAKAGTAKNVSSENLNVRRTCDARGEEIGRRKAKRMALGGLRSPET